MANDYTILPGSFTCDYSGPQMDLQAVIWQLQNNPRFKRFIREQVQKAHSSDPEVAAAAQACLARWYMPTDDELAAIGLPAGPLRCTEHSHLIAAAANS